MIKSAQRPLGGDNEQSGTSKNLAPGDLGKAEVITDQATYDAVGRVQKRSWFSWSVMVILLPETKKMLLGDRTQHAFWTNQKKSVEWMWRIRRKMCQGAS